MTFESHRNRISILKSGRRALESRSATTFATRWHREKGRIAAFEFFFFGCLELREFKYFEIMYIYIYVYILGRGCSSLETHLPRLRDPEKLGDVPNWD